MLGLLVGSWLAAGAAGAGAQSYAACASAPDPVVCVVETADRDQDDELSDDDRIAAGAADTVRLPGREGRIGRLTARVFAGETVSPASAGEAQAVLVMMGDVHFWSYEIPSGPEVEGLWRRALEGPVASLAVAQDLLVTASRSERPDLAAKVAALPALEGRWSNEARAGLADSIARYAGDWRRAEAWMRSGGDRATNYDVEGIRSDIAIARLKEGYDRESARRVLANFLAEDELLPWSDERLEALKTGGAVEELKLAAAALMARGRDPDRYAEDRTNDFAAAAWALQAAGDRQHAVEAAREGAALVPKAVRERIAGLTEGDQLTSQQAAVAANAFGTWPVQMLYRLGQKDEALASGYLMGRERYRDELEMGGQPEPEWLIADGEWFGIKVVAGTLRARGDGKAAARLLAALRQNPEMGSERAGDGSSIRLYRAPELLVLASVAGDASSATAIFRDGLTALDQSLSDEDHGFSAGALAASMRSAERRPRLTYSGMSAKLEP